MLTEQQNEHFRQCVEAELTETRDAMVNITDGGIVDLDQTSVGRLSRMDAMQQQAMASGLQERLSLKKCRLEAALMRLEAGEFGICRQCGDPVSLARLQADLGAPFCAACQDEIDARKKAEERREPA